MSLNQQWETPPISARQPLNPLPALGQGTVSLSHCLLAPERALPAPLLWQRQSGGALPRSASRSRQAWLAEPPWVFGSYCPGRARARIRYLVPKYQMIPILPPSPKFLTLLAEKRSHIAVGHCCALFRHTPTIRHILKWDSLALSYLLTIKCIWKCPDKAFLSFSHVFFAYSLKLRLIVPERSNDPKKCPIQSQKPKFGLCGAGPKIQIWPEINCSHLSYSSNWNALGHTLIHLFLTSNRNNIS